MYIYGSSSKKIIQGTYGRHVIANKFIPIGTVISIEKPILTYTNSIVINYTIEQAKQIWNLAPLIDDRLHKPIDQSEIDKISIFLDEKCKTNAFAITKKKNGIFPKSSMFNHSCDPNICYGTFFGILVMTTQKNISKGEELNISYIGNSSLCTAERQKILKRTWDFDCCCTKCVNNSS